MQHPIRKVLANNQLFDFFFSLFWSIPPKHPSNFISLHLKGLNTPLWWNGRHSGLKIHLKRFSTGSSPVSGTIFLISEQFFCSEIFTFRVGLRWWHWQKTACCFRPDGCRYSLSFRLCCDQAMLEFLLSWRPGKTKVKHSCALTV